MSGYIKVSSKGQITLPAEIRRILNLKQGSYLKIAEEGGVYTLVPVDKGIGDLKGSVQVDKRQDFKKARHQSMEELTNEKHSGD